MSRKEGNQDKEVNLSELFEEKHELGAYDFSWDSLQEIKVGNKTIIYRVAKNQVGVEWVMVLGEKKTDAYEQENQQFINVESLSSREEEEVIALLKQHIKGKIDFLRF